jgi:hypothetical protein
LKKVFRPFWSFDIKDTEEWLHQMALEGHRLIKINTKARLFYFEKTGKTEEIQYRLEYHKPHHYFLPMNLVKSGWLTAYQGTRWSVIYNENRKTDILCFPVREGIIKRNRKLMYFFTGMTVYILLTTLMFLGLAGFTLLIAGGNLTFDGSIFWISTLLVGLITWMLAPYGTVKLYQTNKQFW